MQKPKTSEEKELEEKNWKNGTNMREEKSEGGGDVGRWKEGVRQNERSEKEGEKKK